MLSTSSSPNAVDLQPKLRQVLGTAILNSKILSPTLALICTVVFLQQLTSQKFSVWDFSSTERCVSDYQMDL